MLKFQTVAEKNLRGYFFAAPCTAAAAAGSVD